VIQAFIQGQGEASIPERKRQQAVALAQQAAFETGLPKNPTDRQIDSHTD
jgi:hypothetical protein